MAAADWRVKYDGVCSLCGVTLRAGEVAVYDRPTRTIHCVVCPVDGEQTEVAPIETGLAGASARREYERRKAAREERVHSRFGVRLGRVVLAVTGDPQSTRAWARGASGEEELAKALTDVPDIRVLHDRRVPGTRGNIDHVVVAPAGVFVIDAKRYEGRIEIRNRGNIVRPDHRLYVGRRDCSALADGLTWQVEAVTTALGAAGVDPMLPVTPVLCFVDGDWPLISPPHTFRGVRLEGPKSLRKALTRAARIDTAEAARLARELAVALPAK